MSLYPNPPITEALIDIAVDPLPVSSLAVLESLHDTIREGYPNKETGWESSVALKADIEATAVQQPSRPIGFLFRSQDKKQIVQYRLDGFTFNRLRPYPTQGWPVIRAEARKIGECYLDAIKPTRIVRIGLRYINQITIPARQVDLEHYFTEPPRIPKDLPQALDHFLARLVIPWPELGATAVITQSIVPPPAPDMVSFILDIAVIKEHHGSPDTAGIWGMLERFREFKNTIFESSLTPKTKELFQ